MSSVSLFARTLPAVPPRKEVSLSRYDMPERHFLASHYDKIICRRWKIAEAVINRCPSQGIQSREEVECQEGIYSTVGLHHVKSPEIVGSRCVAYTRQSFILNILTSFDRGTQAFEEE